MGRHRRRDLDRRRLSGSYEACKLVYAPKRSTSRFRRDTTPRSFLLAELCIRLADVRLNPPGDLGTHHSSFQEPDVHRFFEQTPWTPALFCISRIVQPEPIVVQRFLLRARATAAL